MDIIKRLLANHRLKEERKNRKNQIANASAFYMSVIQDSFEKVHDIEKLLSAPMIKYNCDSNEDDLEFKIDAEWSGEGHELVVVFSNNENPTPINAWIRKNEST